jgi:aryl-alcohol dehydrogenase-like predicted oxidoreductase
MTEDIVKEKPNMHLRRFGRTGWLVSEIGYGMWGMGGWTGSDDDESGEALQLAVDLGCNFFDTAWAYGNGRSEKLLGQLVRANPAKPLYTATKIPPKNFKWPGRREFTLDDCFPPEHIAKYVHKSLENLGLTSLGLIQFHTWEDAWADDERWQKQMDDLRRQGLIGGVGISINRWEPWNGVKAVRSGQIDAVQVIYNIFDQNPEDELFPACHEMDVAVIARVPFDEGSLTGQLTLESKWPEGDWRNTSFVAENLKASVAHAEALRSLIPAGLTMPEMALRFILNNPDVSTIIPGMRKPRHVRANLAASDAGPLDEALRLKLKSHRWDRTPTEWSH